jgi:peptidoglycan/xylan/chitin deacetylase (PgdA/CDA1 family)
MALRLISHLRRGGRMLRGSIHSQVLVLMYHRVTELPADPQLLAVTPSHFREHLEVIRKHHHPLRLTDLVDAVRANRLPRRAVVITFDDGYADNLHHAKPLLEEAGIPATIFVAAGFVGHAREFWWDELDKLLLYAGALPATLRLDIDGLTHQWELGDAAIYSQHDFQRHRGWHVEQPEDPTPRHRLYRALYETLYPLSRPAREQALDELRVWSGKGAAARPTHRTVTAPELLELASGDVVEIGAHTVTHPVLTTLSPSEQQREIREGRTQLEEMLERRVPTFAYPHGAIGDATVEAVRSTGFACACSSDPGPVRRGANLFRLPRVVVRDWDGEAFARQMREWWLG